MLVRVCLSQRVYTFGLVNKMIVSRLDWWTCSKEKVVHVCACACVHASLPGWLSISWRRNYSQVYRFTFFVPDRVALSACIISLSAHLFLNRLSSTFCSLSRSVTFIYSVFIFILFSEIVKYFFHKFTQRTSHTAFFEWKRFQNCPLHVPPPGFACRWITCFHMPKNVFFSVLFMLF